MSNIESSQSQLLCTKQVLGVYLLYVLDLHAVLMDECDPFLSQQVACVLMHDPLNFGISLNHKSLCLLQPLVTCIQHLLVFLYKQMAAFSSYS